MVNIHDWSKDCHHFAFNRQPSALHWPIVHPRSMLGNHCWAETYFNNSHTAVNLHISLQRQTKYRQLLVPRRYNSWFKIEQDKKTTCFAVEDKKKRERSGWLTPPDTRLGFTCFPLSLLSFTSHCFWITRNPAFFSCWHFLDPSKGFALLHAAVIEV